MTGQSKHQAWPDKQYAGQAELFEEYECDLQTWLIERRYHEWMKLEACVRATTTAAARVRQHSCRPWIYLWWYLTLVCA